MRRAVVVSGLVALVGVSLMAQAPQVPLLAFASPDAAAAWQAVNDGVMGGMSDGRYRITERQTGERPLWIRTASQRSVSCWPRRHPARSRTQRLCLEQTHHA